jgi:hypothetical protein
MEDWEDIGLSISIVTIMVTIFVCGVYKLYTRDDENEFLIDEPV